MARDKPCTDAEGYLPTALGLCTQHVEGSLYCTFRAQTAPYGREKGYRGALRVKWWRLRFLGDAAVVNR